MDTHVHTLKKAETHYDKHMWLPQIIANKPRCYNILDSDVSTEFHLNKFTKKHCYHLKYHHRTLMYLYL